MLRSLCLTALLACGCASGGEVVDEPGSDAGTGSGTDARVDAVVSGDGNIFPLEDATSCTGPVACKTTCGSAGTRACESGVPAPTCTPPKESCNGVDDDCDGAIDEELTRACTTACGSGTERCSAGAWVGCDAKMPAAEKCDGLDNDCNGKIDDLDCSHTVTCSVFEDGYTSLAGPSDAIFVNGALQSCVPGGATGTCRKWNGRCVANAAADGHTHTVQFQVFDDGYTNMAGPADAVFVSGSSLCVPGSPIPTCRRWFGRAKTNTAQGHSHDVVCDVFDDGFSNPVGPADAIFFNGSQLCVPGGASGQCRRWFGRCVTK